MPGYNTLVEVAEDSIQIQNQIDRRSHRLWTKIGKNGTTVPASELTHILWSHLEVRSAIRKLLSLVFDRKTLATHRLKGYQTENPEDLLNDHLNDEKVEDICQYVCDRWSVEVKLVHDEIISRCKEEAAIRKRRDCIRKLIIVLVFCLLVFVILGFIISLAFTNNNIL